MFVTLAIIGLHYVLDEYHACSYKNISFYLHEYHDIKNWDKPRQSLTRPSTTNQDKTEHPGRKVSPGLETYRTLCKMVLLQASYVQTQLGSFTDLPYRGAKRTQFVSSCYRVTHFCSKTFTILLYNTVLRRDVCDNIVEECIKHWFPLIFSHLFHTLFTHMLFWWGGLCLCISNGCQGCALHTNP